MTLKLDANVSRRRFLRQSLAWSALAALPSVGQTRHFSKFSSDATHALMIGDWGFGPSPEKVNTYTAQSQVAHGMKQYARTHQLATEALFFLGDNWYGNLDDGAQSSRWRGQFEEMYPSEVFPGRAYAMLGNHDYQMLPATVNKVGAELEYARTGRGVDGKPTRWTLPSRWYAFDFPKSNPLIHCIVVDSNMPPKDGAHQQGGAFTLNAEEQAEQLRWLETELRKPRSTPFLVVMGHHPIYSNGPHGDHPVLVRDWDPLFCDHKVDFYFAGHDHDLQVLHFDGHPTTHFLSGGGGADLYVLTQDDSERGPYAQEVHGFSHLAVTGRELQLRHLDTSGRFLFGVAKSPGGKLRVLEE